MYNKYLHVIDNDMYNIKNINVALLSSLGFVHYSEINEWILNVKNNNDLIGFIVYDNTNIYAETPNDETHTEIFNAKSLYVLDTIKQFIGLE